MHLFCSWSGSGRRDTLNHKVVCTEDQAVPWLCFFPSPQISNCARWAHRQALIWPGPWFLVGCDVGGEIADDVDTGCDLSVLAALPTSHVAISMKLTRFCCRVPKEKMWRPDTIERGFSARMLTCRRLFSDLRGGRVCGSVN